LLCFNHVTVPADGTYDVTFGTIADSCHPVSRWEERVSSLRSLVFQERTAPLPKRRCRSTNRLPDSSPSGFSWTKSSAAFDEPSAEERNGRAPESKRRVSIWQRHLANEELVVVFAQRRIHFAQRLIPFEKRRFFF
jgi:hypothetical protein